MPRGGRQPLSRPTTVTTTNIDMHVPEPMNALAPISSEAVVLPRDAPGWAIVHTTGPCDRNSEETPHATEWRSIPGRLTLDYGPDARLRRDI